MNAYLILLMMCAVGSSAAGDSATRPTEEEIRVRTGQLTAVLKYGSERDGKNVPFEWEISARKENDGLHVVVRVDGEEREFDILVGEGIGQLVDLTVRIQRLKGLDLLVGGIASLNSKAQIEYRMFVKHVMAKELPNSASWAITKPVLTRPFNELVHGMSVSFPGGDSVMLGLHTLTRGVAASDQIESHFFVNHCPSPSGELPVEHFEAKVGGEAFEPLRKPSGSTP